MSSQPTDRLRVSCSCGARLAVPHAAAGRKVRCPKCQQTLRVPEADAGASPTPAPAPGAAGSRPAGGPATPSRQAAPPRPRAKADPADDPLSSLASSEAESAAVAAPVSGRTTRCPKCGTTLSNQARLCTACGYDLAAGKALKSAKIKTPSKAGSLLAGLAKSAGSFLLGTVLSGAGALLGAGIWFAVAAFANVELGWIALGLGFLAGLGMKVGYPQENFRAGVVAAAMAAGGILAAKVAIFAFVIYSVFTGATGGIEGKRGYVTLQETEKVLTERGAFTEKAREKEWDSAFAEAKRNVKRMPDSQVEELCKQYQEEERKLAADTETETDPCDDLAWHHAEVRAHKQGRRDDDELESTLHDEELAKCRALTEEQRSQALKEMDAWNEGGWKADPEYVRAELIQAFVDAERSLHVQPTDDPARLAAEEKERYASATAKADAINPEDRLATLEALNAAERKRWEEKIAQVKSAAGSEEVAETEDSPAGALAGIFVRAMFDPLDALFVLLALGAAYRMASGGGSD